MEDNEFEDWYNKADESTPIPVLDNQEYRNLRQQKIWNSISARIRPKKRIKVWQLIAASFLLVGITAMYMVNHLHTESAKVEYVRHQYQTQRGESKEITLPDGSLLYLFADSRVSLDSAHWASNRELLLEEGEIFVDVKRDTAHPFRIHTDIHVIRVLGTSFRVRSYSNDDDREVAVKTGLVEVSGIANQLEKLHLAAGEKLVYQLASGRYQIMEEDVSDIDSKIYGKLVYKQEHLGRILQDLSRMYDVDITCKIPGEEQYTVTFDRKSLQRDLEKLETIGGLKSRRVNGVIEVYK
ncbi:FecR family protein [Sphingobacterium lumbrici]|uniref:FecR family protein n=1 Tax=Sphingobacterium lumbrici TaxID=2559600 RepID=UPI00112E8087|nr:FecR domain-containing protein [Sphingobacterium lumbrici]